jgi:hypothetical protein
MTRALFVALLFAAGPLIYVPREGLLLGGDDRHIIVSNRNRPLHDYPPHVRMWLDGGCQIYEGDGGITYTDGGTCRRWLNGNRP